VFVVASSREGFDPAEVLFEREGLRRDTPPSRSKGQETAKCLTTGVDQRYDPETETLPVMTNSHVSGTLSANAGGLTRAAGNANELDFCVVQPIPISSMNAFRNPDADKSTGVGIGEEGEAMFTLTKGNSHAVAQPMATHEIAGTMISHNGGGGWSNSIDHAASGYMAIQQMAVRRLTPRECERLQGFPDDYTDIPGATDSLRYKALGNSMAVPVMAWIGKRIRYHDTAKIPKKS
jgi:DNA (cytosine-5)-methyltransferase 1